MQVHRSLGRTVLVDGPVTEDGVGAGDGPGGRAIEDGIAGHAEIGHTGGHGDDLEDRAGRVGGFGCAIE